MPGACRALAKVACACALALCLAACGAPSTTDASSGQDPQESPAQQEAAEPTSAQREAETTGERSPIPDGSYDIEVSTDSSMFRAESCTLEVVDGAYTAHLSLPGEGFSRLFFGTAEEAAATAEQDGQAIFEFYLNDDGKYTFDVPVSALDEELPIAAFGHRRDTWYDHTICFHAPEIAS